MTTTLNKYCIILANEREVQNTHKQAQVRRTYKEKKVGILRANRSIKKVGYNFKLADFTKTPMDTSNQG